MEGAEVVGIGTNVGEPRVRRRLLLARWNEMAKYSIETTTGRVGCGSSLFHCCIELGILMLLRIGMTLERIPDFQEAP
jgi:hypothetical protein